jgi:hypothetical protein
LDQNTLKKIVSSFKSLIVCYSNPYDEIITQYVKILEYLRKVSIIPSDAFISAELCAKIPVSHELEKYNNSSFSFVKNGLFLLTTQFKLLFVQEHFKTHLQQTKLKLAVRRDHVLQDTFLFLASLHNLESDLKKTLKIEFKDERGIDAGGLRREFFQLVIEEMFEKNTFFTKNRNFYWFNPDATDPTSF